GFGFGRFGFLGGDGRRFHFGFVGFRVRFDHLGSRAARHGFLDEQRHDEHLPTEENAHRDHNEKYETPLLFHARRIPERKIARRLGQSMTYNSREPSGDPARSQGNAGNAWW